MRRQGALSAGAVFAGHVDYRVVECHGVGGHCAVRGLGRSGAAVFASRVLSLCSAGGVVEGEGGGNQRAQDEDV